MGLGGLKNVGAVVDDSSVDEVNNLHLPAEDRPTYLKEAFVAIMIYCSRLCLSCVAGAGWKGRREVGRIEGRELVEGRGTRDEGG